MNKDQFLQLHQQYSLDTGFLSYTKRDHPAYQEMLTAGTQAVPWLLERLQDSVGHDRGDTFDATNDPWVSLSLLSELTNNECCYGMSPKLTGRLDRVRDFVLAWGKVI